MSFRGDGDSVTRDGSDEDELLARKELSEVSLGELQEIRLKIGTKKFDSVLKDSKAVKENRSLKRANKNRPSEVISKKPVSRFRDVVPVRRKQTESHDPRFDEHAGTFSKDLFKKSFHFIDEMRKNEKLQIHKELKKTRNFDRKKNLQVLLQQMESREAAAAKETESRTVMREHKKAEHELVKKGKKPFHIKKSTQRKMELAHKFATLKKSGKLEKFVEKKRKKNTKRDRKQLPFAR